MLDCTYSTDLVTPREQLSYWNDAICSTFTSLTCERRNGVRNKNESKGFKASVESRDFGGYQLSKVASDPCLVHRTPESVARTDNEVLLLHLQTAGASINSQGDNATELSAGDFTLCLNTSPYQLEIDKFHQMMVMRIPVSNLDGHLTLERLETATKFSYDDHFNRLLVNHLRAVWQQRNHPLTFTESQAVSESTFALLRAAITRSDQHKLALSKDQIQLRAIKQYIFNHISNNRLNATLIAEACNTTQRKLRELFKLEATTCSRFLKEVRLKTVASLLSDPRYKDVTLTKLAFESGFNSSEHFSRSFASYYGITPREYRTRSN